MSRRFSHPQHVPPSAFRDIRGGRDRFLGGGSFRDEEVIQPGYAFLESATLQSEISMSVVTDVTRFGREDNRFGFLRRLTSRQSTDPHERRCRGLLNVEPVIFLVAVALGFLITSKPLFTYWARCIELATSGDDNVTSVCASLSATNGSLQDRVEQDIATMAIWLQVACCIPSLFAAPIIGTWADKFGRKKPLLLTLTGFTLYNIFVLIATQTYETVSIYYWFTIAEVCAGLCGGVSTFFATALAIVTDDCRHKLKPGSSTVPLRIGVASFCQSVGSLIGTFSFTLLAVPAMISIKLHSDSYINSCIIQTLCCATALIYTALFVDETHFPGKNGFGYRQHSDEAEELTDVPDQPNQLGNYMHSLFEVLTQERPGWTRLCLCLSLVFIFVEFLALDQSLLFLFVKRPPFSWSDKTFSYFSLLKNVLFAGGQILVPLMLTCVHWLGKDSIMIIMGVTSSTIVFFLYAFVRDTHAIFLTAAFSLVMGGISPGFRSFLPRMVPKEQTARLFTICSVILSICPIISSLIFNEIFNWSMDWWPGFAFLIGGVIQVIVIIGQTSVHILMRPQWLVEKRARRNLSFVEPVPDHSASISRIPDERSISDTSAAGSASISSSAP